MKRLLWILSFAAILVSAAAIYNVANLYAQLQKARADLASAQKELAKLHDKLSADEIDIKDLCVKTANLDRILRRPENVAARESLGADFLIDLTSNKSVACRLEGRVAP